MAKVIVDITGWVVAVVCDLYSPGIHEDGATVTAESYYVTATSPDGRVIHHHKNWLTSEKKEVDDEGAWFVYFTDERESMRKEADRLVSRIQSAGKVDMSYWTEDYPVYGSKYYIENDGESLLRKFD